MTCVSELYNLTEALQHQHAAYASTKPKWFAILENNQSEVQFDPSASCRFAIVTVERFQKFQA